MAAQYPQAVPDFTGQIGAPGAASDNPPRTVFYAHLADEVVGIATELGVEVSGAFATVAARLAAQAQLATFDRVGVVAVGAGVRRLRFPVAATILGVSAAINEAPTGAALIADVHLSGESVFTTQADRPSIAAGAFDSGAESVPDITAVPAGGYLTVDVDQVGATTAGSDLVVVVRWLPAP